MLGSECASPCAPDALQDAPIERIQDVRSHCETRLACRPGGGISAACCSISSSGERSPATSVGGLLGRPRLALAGDHRGTLRRLGGDDPGLAGSAAVFLGSATRPALLCGEELVKELNGDGAFADR